MSRHPAIRLVPSRIPDITLLVTFAVLGCTEDAKTQLGDTRLDPDGSLVMDASAGPGSRGVESNTSGVVADTSLNSNDLPPAHSDASAAMSSDEPGAPTLDARCGQVGSRACNGAAQDQLLICTAGFWRPNGVCPSDEHCDQSSGKCAPVPEPCSGRFASTTYCDETTRMQCGVDLLGVALESCSEACALVDGEAACVTSDSTTPPGEGTASGVFPTDAIDDSVTSAVPHSSDRDASGTASAAETTPSQEPSEPPPVVIDPNNLFANASFEDGAGDWTTMGNAILVASTLTSHTGERSLLCQGRTQAWEGPSIEALPLVQRGGTYLVSGWVRAASDIGQPFHIVRRAVCLSDAGVEETNDSIIYVQLAGTYTDDAWSQLVSAPFTVPDCVLSTFVIYFEGPSAGNSFYLDDVSLTAYE